MCGRFRVARKKEILEAEFEADSVAGEDWASRDAAHDVPRYNVAPGQEVAVVRQDARQDAAHPVRRLSQMRWGLIPSWTDNPSIGYKMINVRSETAATMRSFREPLRSRRCLIPADGFYEWKREGKQKLPFCFTLADESVFAFAGIWEPWKNPQGQVIESCAILTTTPNELIRDIHDRMPVILPRDAYDIWLDPDRTHLQELQPLLKPYSAESMRRYRVSQRVNHVIHDDPECAAEIDPAELSESRESGPLLY
jgi:putative SOS response-associated peptidase YedK